MSRSPRTQLVSVILSCMLVMVARCPLHAYDTPPALDAALQTAAPGDIVDLGFSSLPSELILNQGANQLSLVAGTLIYSDDPESPSGFGILYADSISAGSSRIYLYHTNDTLQNAKITAVLKNNTASTANVTVTRKAFPTPSTNYVSVGKTAVQQFYESAVAPSSFAINPGAAALLDPLLDSTVVTPAKLLHSIHDLSSDQALAVFSLILQPSSDTLATFASQSFLPNDGYNREGTFPNFGKQNVTPFAYTALDGIKRLKLATAPPWADNVDPPLTGFDAETGGTATLKGNYGVTYVIRVNVASSDGRRVALLLNPRGGAYGGYLRTRFPDTAPPIGQLVPYPTAQVSSTAQGALCATFTPTSSPQTLIIELIPAGASSLPIELLLVPFSNPSRVGDFLMY